ncbi:PEP-CTERM sorting domain-containing protein [bacterium]|nr:PEP-CTERM sorting domain-containing protein [bacterium]
MKQTLLTTSLASALALSSASAATSFYSDTFGDADIANNSDGTVPAGVDSTYSNVVTAGNGSLAESGGSQTYNAGSDNWARTELHHNNDYANPGAGESLTYTWTISNVNITTDQNPTSGANDYRVQLNAISANRAQGTGSERWIYTEGGISLDMFFNATGADGLKSAQLNPRTKSDDQPADSDGTDFGFTNVTQAQWDWTTTANTITLAITADGYTWSDSLGLLNFSQNFADNADLGANPAEFTNGYWAFHSGQNNDQGRGTHLLEDFTATVVTIPEPSAILLSLVGALGLGLRRRR